MIRCNGNYGDCDRCTKTNCYTWYECDVCGEIIDDNYYDIDGEHYCSECLNNEFKRSI